MTIKLKGSSDGSVSLSAPADTSPSGTDITLTLPTDAGSANQFIKNSGTAGTLDYSSMVETSTGIGIGTSSPQTKLHSSGTTNGAQATFGGSDSGLKISTFQKTDNDAGVILDAQQSSNGTLTFATAGTERARITSSGNFGIGTSTPSQILELKTAEPRICLNATNASSDLGIEFEADGQRQGHIFHNHTTGEFSISCGENTSGSHFMTFKTGAGSTRMRIDNEGKIGIGASPGPALLNVYGAESATLYQNSNTGTGSGNGGFVGNWGGTPLYIWNYENSSVQLGTNDAEKMRLDENGLVSTLAGGNSTNYKIRNTAGSSSSIYFIECLSGASGVTSGGTHRFLVATNGGISNYQSNDTNLCDEREKKNIETLDSTWGCLKNWELKKFHYNEDDDTDDKRYGVIAQQVEEHCPELIAPWLKQSAEEAVLDEDGNVVTPAQEEILRKGVKEQQMMWMAIKALQEAQDRIETLETKVAALEAE